ncbi:MAG: FKBP-type peptidyl-prolyl cis-trans isomerase [Candidatus Acidiferrum sp.]
MILLGPAQAQQTPPASASQTPAASSAAHPGAQGESTAVRKPGDPALATQKGKASYAIGLNLGRSMRKDSVDVDPAILLRGMTDGLNGGESLMTDDEVRAAMVALQADLREKHDAKMAVEAEANKKAGDAFLAENKTKAGVVTLPSGLQYKILVAGTGQKPTAADTVVCNYKGMLLDNTEFDSSYKRGKPATIPVTGIIKGWTEALQLMPVGSKWQLFVPPDLAYGPRGGAGGAIGPNATLVFEVELMSIEPKPESEAPNPASKPTPNPHR